MSDPQSTAPGPRVAIVGSRRYAAMDAVTRFIEGLKRKHPRAVVVSGAAAGVDRHAARVAWGNMLAVEEFPADWDRHGRRAGFLRNVAMIDTVDYVVAFWDHFSRGTAHSICIAHEQGKLAAVFGDNGQRLGIDFAVERAQSIQQVGVMVGKMRPKSHGDPVAEMTGSAATDPTRTFRTKEPPR
jgi:hypothetical protein